MSRNGTFRIMIRRLYTRPSRPNTVVVFDKESKRIAWIGYETNENTTEGATHSWGFSLEGDHQGLIDDQYVLKEEIEVDTDDWLSKQLPIVKDRCEQYFLNRVLYARVVKTFEVFIGHGVSVIIEPSETKYRCEKFYPAGQNQPYFPYLYIQVNKQPGLRLLPIVSLKVKAPIECLEIFEDEED